MINCDDECPCPQPPPDRSVQAAVVGGLFGLLAAVGPELVRLWRERRRERMHLERRLGVMEGAIGAVSDNDEKEGSHDAD